jgi:hypothetical protein
MSDIGYGCEVWVGATAAATTATVKLLLITSHTPPEVTRDEVEVTNEDSGAYMKEFIPGLTDPGEFQFGGNYVPNNATETALLAMLAERTGRMIEFRFTNVSGAPIYRGRAWLKSFVRGVPMDDKMTFEATLRAVGAFSRVAV